MEELVNRLAYLEHNLKEEHDANENDETLITLRKAVSDREHDLQLAKDALKNEMKYSIGTCDLIKSEIEATQAQIVDAWDGENKTLKFDAGALKFRTTTSLEIRDEGTLLANLFANFHTFEVAEKYISGFNKTAVKKYMEVHDLATVIAELIPKTTAKLEEGSG